MNHLAKVAQDAVLYQIAKSRLEMSVCAARDQGESLRAIAKVSRMSHETIRRIVRAA